MEDPKEAYCLQVDSGMDQEQHCRLREVRNYLRLAARGVFVRRAAREFIPARSASK
jgi:hypothetical protein